MSLLAEVKTAQGSIRNEIELLWIEALTSVENNICFYNEEIKVNRLNDEQLKKVIPYLNDISYCIHQDTHGYSILLEHIPTGMLLEYIVFNESGFPYFQQNKCDHCILKVFKDNFIEDYLVLNFNEKLVNILDDITYRALMYQDFKELLENRDSEEY